MQTASPLLEQLSLIMLCKCPLHLTEDRAAYRTIEIKIDTAKFSFLAIERALKKSNRSCRRCSKYNVKIFTTMWRLWLWRWLPHRLSKRQSLPTTTVLFRTTFTQTIKLNLLLKWVLGSNLSQCSFCYNLSKHCERKLWPRFFQDLFHFRLGYQLLLLPKTATYSFSRFRLIKLIVEVTTIFWINYFFNVEHIRENAELESHPIVRGK